MAVGIATWFLFEAARWNAFIVPLLLRIWSATIAVLEQNSFTKIVI